MDDLSGFHTVVGSVVDSAGVTRAKQVPAAKAGAFAAPGLGVSPTWAVFCADDHIAFTPRLGVVGDWRMRVELDRLADLGNGVAWAPAGWWTQDGEPVQACARHALRRQVHRAAEAGLAFRCGIELECTLYDLAGARVGGPAATGPPGPAYGLRPLAAHEGFLAELCEALARAGLDLEQLHAEWGPGQLELSLAPAEPMKAADDYTLARIVLARVARRHGLLPSLSPKPDPAEAGCGAHIHLSATDRAGHPLLSGGAGPHGLPEAGGRMIAGLLDGLGEATAVLSGSATSMLRFGAHSFAGWYLCWGLENREAAVRLCQATPGSHYGAHVEVKPADPSANPYLAVAVLLGLAMSGLQGELRLPPPVDEDPGLLGPPRLAERGIAVLPTDLREALSRLDGSARLREILPPASLEGLIAVRSHEADLAGSLPPAELAALLRFAWTC